MPGDPDFGGGASGGGGADLLKGSLLPPHVRHGLRQIIRQMSEPDVMELAKTVCRSVSSTFSLLGSVRPRTASTDDSHLRLAPMTHTYGLHL